MEDIMTHQSSRFILSYTHDNHSNICQSQNPHSIACSLPHSLSLTHLKTSKHRQ
uniref:Uncharacterized protein n=1 Tax=Rhizophora mucronata TaxID=61149 RepID=A0A2P2PIU3_RHIMU